LSLQLKVLQALRTFLFNLSFKMANMKNFAKKYVFPAVLAASLSACGGGGTVYIEDGAGSGPRLSVDLRAAQSTVRAGEGVFFNAAVYEGDGRVYNVRFYSIEPDNSSRLLFDDNRAPFEASIIAPAGRPYFDVYAVAQDEFGDQATSPVVSVRVGF
jgi:hypothetical protein